MESKAKEKALKYLSKKGCVKGDYITFTDSAEAIDIAIKETKKEMLKGGEDAR